MRGLALIVAVSWAGPVAAEGFETCFSRAIAHFEMGIARSGPAGAVEDYALVTRDRVHHCGSLAIVACDRGDAPQACQRRLAAEQRALRARVLEGLPAPEEVPEPEVLPGLYPQLWDVAHGSSAGDDCAGAEDPVAAWCETHEARLKLTEAVALWQVARLMGVAGAAADLGWIAQAMQFRPVARPEGEGR